MAGEKLAPDVFAFPEVAAPGTPDAGYVYLYFKSDGKAYRKDDTGTETELGGAGGGMTDFTLDADTGTPQTVEDGETVDIEGGAGIDTVVGATNKVTVAVDSTVIRTTGTQSIGTGLTIDTPTIANLTNAQHDHTDADDGGQLTDAALSAPVSISKGGHGQSTQTAGFDALAPTTTKGDLIVHNGSDNVRVAVGANGTHLRANSADAEGVDWNYGLELIASGELGAGQTTITLSSIPAVYQDLILVVRARSSAGGTSVQVTFNADTGNNYSVNLTSTNDSGTGTNSANNNLAQVTILHSCSTSSATSGYFGHLYFYITGYAESAKSRNGFWNANRFESATSHFRNSGTFAWENVSNALSSIELNLNAGDFATGTIYALYGVGTAT